MRTRELEEGELDRAEFGAELERMLVLLDRHVLNEVPNVVVLLGRKPVGSAETAVAVDVGGRQTAVQRTRRIVTADAKRFELVHVGQSLRARRHQAAEPHAGFSHKVRTPRPCVREHRIPRQRLFNIRSKIGGVQRARQRLSINLVAFRPAHAAENVVLVANPVIQPDVELFHALRTRCRREVVVQRNTRSHRHIRRRE